MAILVRIEALGGYGDCKIKGFDDKNWFVADSFSFGVERELKESGEKGGTEDINIGVGELQECSISKSLDSSSTTLAQAAINGNSLGQGEIAFVEVAGPSGGADQGSPSVYLLYKMDRVFVKSWSTSGDADDRPTEEVAFLYNKFGMGYCAYDGKQWTNSGRVMSWDNVTNTKWETGSGSKSSHGIPTAALAHGFIA